MNDSEYHLQEIRSLLKYSNISFREEIGDDDNEVIFFTKIRFSTESLARVNKLICGAGDVLMSSDHNIMIMTCIVKDGHNNYSDLYALD